MTLSVFERIEQFNQGRDEKLLKLKYQKMTDNPFLFFRGTCHLFYEDWANNNWAFDYPLEQVPLAWICGDLHLENFGSYEGDNRLTYFDINDFDEGILAPCLFDVIRLLTSIFLAFPEHHNDNLDPQILGSAFVHTYTAYLASGKARWIERDNAQGIVKKLLKIAQEENDDRKGFLDKKTELKSNTRKIKIKEGKNYRLDEDTENKVKEAVEKFGQTQKNPDFFKVLDVVGRIAGTASLGLPRYAVLVEGEGSPNQNYLLDIKLSVASALEKYVKITQPQWENHAQRIVAIQERAQAIPPDLFHVITINEQFYIINELQPSEDKVDLEALKQQGDLSEVVELIKILGRVVACCHIRSGGRQGSSITDDFIALAENKTWQMAALSYADNYSKQVVQDWQDFKNDPSLVALVS